MDNRTPSIWPKSTAFFSTKAPGISIIDQVGPLKIYSVMEQRTPVNTPDLLGTIECHL